MNYQANLDWMEHLRSLKIPFEQRIIEGVPHSAQMVYEKVGLDVMKFHADNFKKPAKYYSGTKDPHIVLGAAYRTAGWKK
jgi:hypothetical protein